MDNPLGGGIDNCREIEKFWSWRDVNVERVNRQRPLDFMMRRDATLDRESFSASLCPFISSVWLSFSGLHIRHGVFLFAPKPFRIFNYFYDQEDRLHDLQSHGERERLVSPIITYQLENTPSRLQTSFAFVRFPFKHLVFFSLTKVFPLASVSELRSRRNIG